MTGRRPVGDAIIWLMLGLIVTIVLIATTHHGVASTLQRDPPRQLAHPTSLDSSRNTKSVHSGTHTKANAQTLRATPGALHSTSSTTMIAAQTTTITPTVTTSPQQSAITAPVTPLVNATLRGTLHDLSDIATSYPVAVGAGMVSASLTWSGPAELSLALRCPSFYLVDHSALGLVTLSGPTQPGLCVVRVALITTSNLPATRYSISLHLPRAS